MRASLAERMTDIPLSGIREIYEKARLIPDVIRLEFGEPDFETPQHIIKAGCDALEKGATKYGSSYGIPELRQAVATKMAKENGVKSTQDNVVITVGCTTALCLSVLATVNRGDEVLIPDPGWATYVPLIRIGGSVPIPYHLKEENGFRPDIDDLAKLITPRTRMIVLNSPNNPTGGILEIDDLKAIGELAVKKNLLILSDEVYEKFVYDGEKHVSIASFPSFRENAITVNSLSKTYAMTGWRVGYAVAPEQIAEAIGRLNASVNSCPPTMNQMAGVAALTGTQAPVAEMVKTFDRRRKVIIGELNGIDKLSCDPPKGAFYAFVNISKTGYRSHDFAMRVLEKAHVATVPGSAFGERGEGYLRLAYANGEEKIREAILRIGRLIARS